MNEALFLSEKEEASINNIVQNIQQGCKANIDQFTQNIIVSQIEAWLNYAERFYQRHFITRGVPNHKIRDCLEELLNTYVEDNTSKPDGLPTVQRISEALQISPDYLRNVLKLLTSNNTQ